MDAALIETLERDFIGQGRGKFARLSEMFSDAALQDIGYVSVEGIWQKKDGFETKEAWVGSASDVQAADAMEAYINKAREQLAQRLTNQGQDPSILALMDQAALEESLFIRGARGTEQRGLDQLMPHEVQNASLERREQAAEIEASTALAAQENGVEPTQAALAEINLQELDLAPLTAVEPQKTAPMAALPAEEPLPELPPNSVRGASAGEPEIRESARMVNGKASEEIRSVEEASLSDGRTMDQLYAGLQAQFDEALQNGGLSEKEARKTVLRDVPEDVAVIVNKTQAAVFKGKVLQDLKPYAKDALMPLLEMKSVGANSVNYNMPGQGEGAPLMAEIQLSSIHGRFSPGDKVVFSHFKEHWALPDGSDEAFKGIKWEGNTFTFTPTKAAVERYYPKLTEEETKTLVQEGHSVTFKNFNQESYLAWKQGMPDFVKEQKLSFYIGKESIDIVKEQDEFAKLYRDHGWNQEMADKRLKDAHNANPSEYTQYAKDMAAKEAMDGLEILSIEERQAALVQNREDRRLMRQVRGDNRGEIDADGFNVLRQLMREDRAEQRAGITLMSEEGSRDRRDALRLDREQRRSTLILADVPQAERDMLFAQLKEAKVPASKEEAWADLLARHEAKYTQATPPQKEQKRTGMTETVEEQYTSTTISLGAVQMEGADGAQIMGKVGINHASSLDILEKVRLTTSASGAVTTEITEEGGIKTSNPLEYNTDTQEGLRVRMQLSRDYNTLFTDNAWQLSLQSDARATGTSRELELNHMWQQPNAKTSYFAGVSLPGTLEEVGGISEKTQFGAQVGMARDMAFALGQKGNLGAEAGWQKLEVTERDGSKSLQDAASLSMQGGYRSNRFAAEGSASLQALGEEMGDTMRTSFRGQMAYQASEKLDFLGSASMTQYDPGKVHIYLAGMHADIKGRNIGLFGQKTEIDVPGFNQEATKIGLNLANLGARGWLKDLEWELGHSTRNTLLPDGRSQDEKSMDVGATFRW